MVGIWTAALNVSQGQGTGGGERGGYGGEGGGGRGGRGGGGDPMMFFNMLSRGKDTITRTELDPRGQMIFDKMAEKMGATNGVITRDQFQKGIDQAKAGGGSGGTPPSTPAPATPTASPTPTPEVDAEKQKKIERWGDEMFRQADKNKDGLLDYEEMSETMRTERDKWDANKDGFIDSSEYKPYIVAWVARRQEERNEGKDNNNNDSKNNPPIIIEQPREDLVDEPKAPVYRAGKLPKGLPSWFESFDTNIDGQVGLYEWREAGRSIPDFQKMDRNGDGLLTIAESLSFEKLQEAESSKESRVAGNPVAFNANPGGRERGMKKGEAGGGFKKR